MKVLSLTSFALMAFTFASPVFSCRREGQSCRDANIGDRVCACGDPNKILECVTANGKTWLELCQCGPNGGGQCGNGRCPNGTPNDPCNRSAKKLV